MPTRTRGTWRGTWRATWRDALARLTPARPAPERPDPATAPRPPWEQTGAEAAAFGTATAGDLAACFRLLENRRPTRAEWHAALPGVGGSLRDMVAARLSAADAGGTAPRNGVDLREAPLPGFRLLADPADAAVGRHVLGGAYEPDVSAVFRTLLKPGMGVVDIGANIGWFTMLSASLVGPDGFVLAIEPNPANARAIEASRRLNGFDQVQVAQVAAGPELAMLVLHKSFSTGTTSDVPGGDAASVLGAETVPCVRPDALVPAGRPIDLIKVDVDGSDYRALLGCTGIIARDRPAIVTEFSPSLLRSLSGITGMEFLRWFATQGYRVAIIGPDGSPEPVGDDLARVLAEHDARAATHVDLLATPDGAWPGRVSAAA